MDLFLLVSESLLVMSSLGVQLTTTFATGRTKSTFFDITEVKDIIINEAVTMVRQEGFLAHLIMSLCNHALSVVCRCHRHWCQRLCTALPVTGLIIEASYLTNICSYAPSICT